MLVVRFSVEFTKSAGLAMRSADSFGTVRYEQSKD